MPTDARSDLLDAVERRLHDLGRRRRSLELQRLLRGPGADDEAIESSLDAEEAAILGEPDYASLMTGEDDQPDRRLVLHRHRWPEAVIRTDPEISGLTRELAARMTAFEPWAGDQPASRSQVAELLRTEPDRSAREAAWFADLPLAASIEPDLQRLMGLRNARARTLGGDDFPEMLLPAGELSKLSVLTLGDELEPLTKPLFEAMLTWIRRENGGATLEPWDIDYHLARLEPPVQDVPGSRTEERLNALTRGLGLDPATTGISIHDAGSGSPRMIAVSIPDDIHCFLTHRDGAPAFMENLAAWGQALHAAHTPASPLAFQWTAGGFNEAMASLMPIMGTAAVVAGRGGLEADTNWRAWQAVWTMRRALASSLFEILAYESPESDLHGLWCEIQEHYLGFPRHPERLWATEERFVTRPLTGSDFLIGPLMGAQLAEALTTTVTLSADVWAPGAKETSEALVERVTGRILDPDAWMRGIGAEVSG